MREIALEILSWLGHIAGGFLLGCALGYEIMHLIERILE